MQKIFTKKHYVMPGILVILSLFTITFLIPVSVYADVTSDAKSYCDNKYKTSSLRSSCLAGYLGGNSGQANACSRTSGPGKDACLAGFSKGESSKSGSGSGSSGSGSGGGGGSGGTSSGTGADSGASGSGSGAESTPAPGPETINCGDEGVNCTDPAASKTGTCDNNGCNLIGRYVNPAITMLSAAVLLAAIISIIYGGIQYSMSAGDPQKITEAKSRISKTLIAFVFYLLLFSFLQFLIPGGFLGRG